MKKILFFILMSFISMKTIGVTSSNLYYEKSIKTNNSDQKNYDKFLGYLTKKVCFFDCYVQIKNRGIGVIVANRTFIVESNLMGIPNKIHYNYMLKILFKGGVVNVKIDNVKFDFIENEGFNNYFAIYMYKLPYWLNYTNVFDTGLSKKEYIDLYFDISTKCWWDMLDIQSNILLF